MTKLVLVRHGESEWNKLNLFTGWTDVEITKNLLSLMECIKICLKKARE